MKIALSKSSLLIPPTYFAVAHALKMSDQMEFRFFTMAAEIADMPKNLQITDFAPQRHLPFKDREKYLPFVMPRMAKAIADYEPDVIHQHFATWSWPAVKASKSRGTPLLTTVHGADVVTAGKKPTSLMARWHGYNLRGAMEQSTRILAVSRYLAGLAVENGFPADKVEVHYLGVDTDIFLPGERNAANPAPVALFIGALNHQKGITHLIEASNELIGGVPHRLVIAGRGILENEIETAARQSSHISFLGPLSRQGVLEQLQQADVLIAPSRLHHGAREAAGLILLEAQACGTPVIAYKSGGISEMVGPESGYLVPEDDIQSLRRRMEDIFRMDPQSRDQLRTSARAFAMTERSLEKSCLELSEHYHQLADAKRT
jgi:glycosyltransferase involved in cell wall biosynthesis